MSELLDTDARRRAVHERERNVVVDASAGTGKTKLVVERFVELIAPSDGREPIPIDRIAAITFTRKAAGELRVRTRQRILESVSQLPPNTPRARALLRALGGIDTANISTIHGFADRLLRKWPAQSRLDPRYELDDDDTRLIDECFTQLVHAAEAGVLREVVRSSSARERADEAIATILASQRAGLRMRSLATEFWTYHGLDGLVAGFVAHRDVEPRDPPLADFDRAAFERYAGEHISLVEGISAETRGGRWLLDNASILRRVISDSDPALIFHEIVERFERGPRGRASDPPRLAHDFTADERAWDVWKAFDGDQRQEAVRAGSLRDDLLAPLRRWLAIRLVRLRPVVLDVYELVKARHQAVDHIDLLLRLRNLLRDDRQIRRACQNLFDHIFVDEFQDTDPLQAEIVMFLCERGAEAATWGSVKLAPGSLTVVGDPKQSIYRFRRADIATYQQAIEVIERSPHLSVRLTSSFRTAPNLVDWLNNRFAEILGVGEAGQRFRRNTGQVFHQPLSKGRAFGVDPTVRVVAMELPGGGNAAECRALEAETMARYLRWLVDVGRPNILDPHSNESRPVAYGDIGILAITTSNLPVLFDALDGDDVPYAARGGALFLRDPLQRRFLLGLCALADRDDGVALAALLRPPFFAVDLADLARARVDDPQDRAAQARAVVRELRRRRFERSPGETARALLEETGIGRTIALGPNATQRLSGLQELCFQIETRATEEHLDFDAVMERVRGWIDEPIGLDRPPPVGSDAVRILTVHQAKGLEFPAVILWDARAAWHERISYDPWTVDRNGAGWAMRLDRLRWEEPVGLDIAEQERALRTEERKRLVYVAATRARDILVVPRLGASDDRRILDKLVGTQPSSTVLEHPVHTREKHAVWFDEATPKPRALPTRVGVRDLELSRTWSDRSAAALRGTMRPVAFTDARSPRTLWGKKGRYGTMFGETVHLAIGRALRRKDTPDEAVLRAAAQTGLATNHDEAVCDVQRALATLSSLGVVGDHPELQLEYPVAGVSANGDLVAGYVDLVAKVGDRVIVLDFKTDAPPESDESIPQPYAEQVTGYREALEQALNLPIRSGLLFTADGGIRWLSSGDNA